MDAVELRERLKEVEDPRRQWGHLRHKLEDVLVIGLSAIICKGDSYWEMEDWGLEREDQLKKFLELPNGIPDETTFFRVFSRIKPEPLAKILYEWIAESREHKAGFINIDGKTIRGSARDGQNPAHIVSAWAGEEEIILGQVAVDEKSNEILAIPRLLDLFDVKDSVITIDAMGCQTEIAKKIRSKGADYILAVKENQKTLYEDIKDYFDGLDDGSIPELPEDKWITDEEKGHGRVEKREVTTVQELAWVSGVTKWKDLKTIIRCRSWRTVKGETKQTDRYYISSLQADAELFYRGIRGHWSIENKLHWSLDVVFREDASRAAKGHAAENLNILRKIALVLLRAAPIPGKFAVRHKTMSGPRKRFLARILEDYWMTVLLGE